MKLVSIDLETSSLHPNSGQILQFGAVVFDTDTNKFECKRYKKYVLSRSLKGSWYAINMNLEIIKTINDFFENPDKYDEQEFIRVDHLAEDFRNWLDKNLKAEGRIIVVGKNFLQFDDKFLQEVPEWNMYISYIHRTIDVASLYATKTDVRPPSLTECKERALSKYPEKVKTLFSNSVVSHDALEDAEDVAKLIWLYYSEQQ